ncbi:venom carboxylesterase-6-like [Cimex lectularius]|uniref:Carboxylesterase type B domain-containing protein n=1 Tax=Cimex lectularius TaxID=79782 RepID=A0A8I6TGU5_CIMLE|nr:venom carboxylesterase-6-like [Cimex lectularius]
MIIVLLTCLLCGVSAQVVETRLGKIQGTSLISRSGKEYLAFFSIPYAKPPIGDLRLKNPQPSEKWENVLDGTQPPSMCVQFNLHAAKGKRDAFGSEDCLYVNVFTPETSPKELLPVLVFIHGGSWRAGGAPGKYGAGYIMDEDVILITMQYRVGILGFLSTEDDSIPGNFGLKDQAQALKWVKENIKSFGGDPEKITVFGMCAGGASVYYQAISPLTKDLIQGAIAEGGVANKFWGLAQPGSAKKLANKLAGFLDCPPTSEELWKCLINKKATDIQEAEEKFIYWDIEPLVVFQPVIEKPNEGAFLTEDPMKTKLTLPLITGFSNDEGLIKIGSLAGRDESETELFLNNTEQYLKKMLYVEESEELDQTVKAIMDRYFSGTLDDKINGLKEFYSFMYYVTPVYKLLQTEGENIHMYVYNYKSGQSAYNLFSGGKNFQGVGHADSLLILFNMTEHFPNKNPDEEEASKNLIQLWTDFAKSGEPSLEKISWKEGKTGDYLEITKDKMMKKDYKKKELQFWMDLPLIKNINIVTHYL